MNGDNFRQVPTVEYSKFHGHPIRREFLLVVATVYCLLEGECEYLFQENSGDKSGQPIYEIVGIEGIGDLHGKAVKFVYRPQEGIFTIGGYSFDELTDLLNNQKWNDKGGDAYAYYFNSLLFEMAKQIKELGIISKEAEEFCKWIQGLRTINVIKSKDHGAVRHTSGIKLSESES